MRDAYKKSFYVPGFTIRFILPGDKLHQAAHRKYFKLSRHSLVTMIQQ
jgi:hypothetical protein